MHAALERVLSELGGPLTVASLQTALGLLDVVLAEVAADPKSKLSVGQPEAVRVAALRAIEADLRRFLTQEAGADGGWAPHVFEQRFGFDDDSLPALELSDGDQRILIRGAIDRLDVDGQGHAIVRDYKSGASRPAFPAARWEADRQLQVALYLLVVRELTEFDPIGGFYQPLRGDDLRPRGVFLAGADVGPSAVRQDARESDEFAALLDDTAARAVALATALRRGR